MADHQPASIPPIRRAADFPAARPAGAAVAATRLRFPVGAASALVFLKEDGVMPLAWVIFSTKEPSDVLLVAVTLTLLAHRSDCVEGRDFL